MQFDKDPSPMRQDVLVEMNSELLAYLGDVAGKRQQPSWNAKGAQALWQEPSHLRHVLSQMSQSIGSLVEAIAYDLNLSRPRTGEESVIPAPMNQRSQGWMLEEELRQKERMECRAKGYRDVAGESVLTQLRRVRDSIRMNQEDIKHLEARKLKDLTDHQQQLHQQALLWSRQMLRKGIRLEAMLECSMLEDQIQVALNRQAVTSPASHEYLRILLDVENMEMQKRRIEEQRIQQEAVLLRQDIALVKRALEQGTQQRLALRSAGHTQQVTECEAELQTLRQLLGQLQAEEQLLRAAS